MLEGSPGKEALLCFKASCPGLHPPHERHVSTYWGWAQLLWLSSQEHRRQGSRHIGLNPRLGERRHKESRDGVQIKMREGSCKSNSSICLLEDIQLYIHVPLTVTILGEKWLAKFQCPRKKMIIILKNPFEFPPTPHLPLKDMYKIYWEKKNLFILFSS